MSVALSLSESLAADPPRATGFIVTVYGDVVQPRGGALWMGSLIETCAAQGISESLVRTAVSRLVAAGQLEGERIGRRSFYRLSPEAAGEYARAGRLFYGAPQTPDGWCLALGPTPDAPPSPWVRLGPEVALAPGRDDIPSLPGVRMTTQGVAGLPDLPAFAARHWPLSEAAAGYARVLDRFAGMAEPPENPAAALALRLRLIHLYRLAVLRDPRLPREALPDDWPGTPARRRFVDLYRGLAAPADAHIAAHFFDSEGPLPAQTPETVARYALLRQDIPV